MRRLALLVLVVLLPAAQAQLPDDPLPGDDVEGPLRTVEQILDPHVRFQGQDHPDPGTPDPLPPAADPRPTGRRDRAQARQVPTPLPEPPDTPRQTSIRPAVRATTQDDADPATPTQSRSGPPVTLVASAGAVALAIWLLRRRLPEDPTRRRLLRLVRRDPGRNLSDLARELGVDRTTVRHHVDRLVEEGRVTCRRQGRCRRVYPEGADGDELADLLDHPVRRWILRRLLRRRRLDQRRLRDECDVAPSTLTYHAKRLESAGLLERSSRGRRTVLALVDAWRRRLLDRGL